MVHRCRHLDALHIGTTVKRVVVDILGALRQHHVDYLLAICIVDMLRCVGWVSLGIVEVCLGKALHIGDEHLVQYRT